MLDVHISTELNLKSRVVHLNQLFIEIKSTTLMMSANKIHKFETVLQNKENIKTFDKSSSGQWDLSGHILY